MDLTFLKTRWKRISEDQRAQARWRSWLVVVVALAAGLSLVPALAAAIDAVVRSTGSRAIEALGPAADLDAVKVALGRKLFHDVRLSGDDSVACASCHDLARGGDDGRARNRGRDGAPLDFNTPTVFNAALSFRLNWRGNFRDFKAQNEAALLDPRLMGAEWQTLLPKLRADPDYAREFVTAYGRPTSREDVLDSLAAFQLSLVTTGARFDRYLAGDRGALAPAEERGWALFQSYGCVSCHQGRNVGGNMFQRFGIFANPFADRDARSDLGRFTITWEAADLHVFRVPSLRNVAATAPYLHDGSAATLDEVIAIMGRNQLGVTLPPGDIDRIAQFLRTLTGEYLGRPVDAEEHPP